VLRSPDLVNWNGAGRVFASKPSWITTTSPGNPNQLWAPDISFFGGEYHLYYAASTFGSRNSCIGHATSPSLVNPVWTDRGEAVICSTEADDWNAIDPALVLDAGGQPWLAFGSFWGGLKLIPLEADGDRDGTQMYALATRANQEVEAPYIVRRGGWYYLFESVDRCCQGVNSTYKQMVGRSSVITGPYVDRDGMPLLSGGGTLLVEGDDRWKGPGHNAVIDTGGGGGWNNVYHSYDADAGGIPTLRIAELMWGADGWPVSAGP
jgi:arabinan endo-1,5-alpha-L-arabinosidase